MLRRSLHRGSSQVCSEPTHLTILTVLGGAVRQGKKRQSLKDRSPEVCAEHLSTLLLVHAEKAAPIHRTAWEACSRKCVCTAGLPCRARRCTRYRQAS
jgi:hypothetical protein